MVASRSFRFRLKPFLFYLALGTFAFIAVPSFPQTIVRSCRAGGPILRDMHWSIQLAAQTASAKIVALPMLTTYSFFRRYFIKGILLVGIIR